MNKDVSIMPDFSPKDRCFPNLIPTQQKSNFDILIVATMSAGKSTLINAMLGEDLIPSKNEACTAIVTKVFNKKDVLYPHARFLSENNNYSVWSSVDNTLLQKFNENIEIQSIEVNYNILHIDNTENINVVLMDTPGPNNSMDSSHENITKDILEKCQPDIILYLLNSTQLSTNDDLKLLKLLKNTILSADKNTELVFVANKIDCFDPEKGESINCVINNVNSYLIDNGFNNPTVIPVSAELAKLIRLEQKGIKLSRLQKNRINSQVQLFLDEPEMNLLQQSKTQISKRIYSQLIGELDYAQKQNNGLKQVEILSGIPVLEALINEKVSLSDNKLFKVEKLLQQ